VSKLSGVVLAILLSSTPSLVSADDVPDVAPGQTVRINANNGDATDLFQTLFTAGGGYVQLTTPNGGQRAEAFTHISLGGLGESISAFGQLDGEFGITGTRPTVLDASVTMTVEWDGLMYIAAGLGTAGGHVIITAQLVQGETVMGQTTVLDKALDAAVIKHIDTGGTRVHGTSSVVFSGKVTRGHGYAIRLKVECITNTGLVGLESGCDFASTVSILSQLFPKAPFIGDRYVTWTDAQVTVADDIFEKLDTLEMKLDAANASLAMLNDKVDVMQGELEALGAGVEGLRTASCDLERLVSTPQGQRASDIAVCTDQPGFPYDFPEPRLSGGNSGPGNGNGNGNGSSNGNAGGNANKSGKSKGTYSGNRQR